MEKREILLVTTVFAVLATAPPGVLGQDQGAPYELIGPFNSYVTVYDNHNVEPMRALPRRNSNWMRAVASGRIVLLNRE